MKRPGFMLFETMLALGFMTVIAMLTLNIIQSNVNRAQTLKDRYALLSELKNHLTLKLLNPAQKTQDVLLFQSENIIIKTKITEIEPKSSLKNYIPSLKILNVSGHKDGDKSNPINIMGLVMTPQPQAQK